MSDKQLALLKNESFLLFNKALFKHFLVFFDKLNNEKTADFDKKQPFLPFFRPIKEIFL